jgi:hypothetical protein
VPQLQAQLLQVRWMALEPRTNKYISEDMRIRALRRLFKTVNEKCLSLLSVEQV